jgi:fructose-bisphosphate aldolase class II
MTLATMRQILDHAAERGYGIPAFNITNLESLLAVLQAANWTDSPVIVQASQSAQKYADDVLLSGLVKAAAQRFPNVPICFHQDHGSTPQVCESAISLGFTSVMMDGSLEADGKTPAGYDYNVDVTARTVAYAHARGVSVEGEIGVLGSLETGGGEQEDGHGLVGTLDREALLTDPAQAATFVAATGVDALAVAIGTSHGAYKFSRKPTGDILAMDVIAAIHQQLPYTHLVMHGASTVPSDLQDLINESGGHMPKTFGVPLEEVEAAIRMGVRKINIDTDLRMALTGSTREYLQANPGSFDIRGMLKPGIARMEAVCVERFERFGAAGNASRIKVLPLDSMIQFYA